MSRLKRLPVWRDCTLCEGAGTGIEIDGPWRCSACRGTGALCDTLPPRFPAVEKRVMGFVKADKDRLIERWVAVEKQAADALLAGIAEAGWYVEQAEAARAALAAMGARQ